MDRYPSGLVRSRSLGDGRKVVIRPIRPEDEEEARRFWAGLSAEAKRLRFMKFVGALSDKLVHTFTNVDYDEKMAFVCEAQTPERAQIVGEARYAAMPDGRSCEFGVVVADAWRKSGVAGLLMAELIAAARAHGFETMEGLVLRENAAERRFARALGFVEFALPEEPLNVRIVKRL